MAVELVGADAPYADLLRFVARDGVGNPVNVSGSALRAAFAAQAAASPSGRELFGGDYWCSDYGCKHSNSGSAAQRMSVRYNSVNDAIAEFPEMERYRARLNLTATTLDWFIIQALMLRANAQHGGVVHLISGKSWISQTLYKPEAGEGLEGDGTNAVSVRGAGQQASFLCATAELSASDQESGRAYMMTCTNRETTGRGAVGDLSDFSFIGPGGNHVLGLPVCATNGLGWGSRCKLHRLGFQNCHLAMDTMGDHTDWTDLRFIGNSVSIYFRGRQILFGDYGAKRITADFSTMATFVAGPETSIPKMEFTGFISAATPRHFYKEWGGSKAFIFETTTIRRGLLENTGCDYMNNGWPITTDRAAPFGRKGDNTPRAQREGIGDDYFGYATVNGVVFEDMQFGPYSDQFKPAATFGWVRGYGWNCAGTFNGMVFRNIMEPSLMRPNFPAGPNGESAGAPGTFNFISGSYRFENVSIGILFDEAKTALARLFRFGPNWRFPVTFNDVNEGSAGAVHTIWDDGGTPRPLFRYELVQDLGGAVMRTNHGGSKGAFMGVCRREPGVVEGGSAFLVQSKGVCIVKVEAGSVAGPLMVGTVAGQAKTWNGTNPADIIGCSIGNPFTGGFAGDSSGQLYCDFRFKEAA